MASTMGLLIVIGVLLKPLPATLRSMASAAVELPVGACDSVSIWTICPGPNAKGKRGA